MPPETTIPVKRATVARLVKHGTMRETYDHLINRILDNYESDHMRCYNATNT